MNTHEPVMLKEMLELLSPKEGSIYVDATFGGGGYSKGILESAKCSVLGMDQDSTVEWFYKTLHDEFPGRVRFCVCRFSKLQEAVVFSLGIENIDGIVFDVGVSSMQLGAPDRGFSFMHDGPLDMRMGQSVTERSAEMFVRSLPEKDMADVIFYYGGERLSRRVARAIASSRSKINSTRDLANIVRSVVPRSKAHPIDPATRTFQAIRIWVNDELTELKAGLIAASRILNIGGKIVVTSFHSLEDRIVKQEFSSLCSSGRFRLLNRKVIRPSEEEIRANSRARSAKMRAIIREY
ncbi:MAG: 16S rRNA (cytosine(1402)-N(4))-methyltransferase RsmH [Aaplasma endosymbiont of Hyalomma asiaticum]